MIKIKDPQQAELFDRFSELPGGGCIDRHEQREFSL